MPSTNKSEKKKIKYKSKIDYKHNGFDVSNCNVQCFSKILNPCNRKCHKLYPLPQESVKYLKVDPLLSLVQKKKEHQLKIETIKYKYQKYKKRSIISKQSQCYKLMQDVISQDPDQYFCSNYNWYFTGGNLKIQEIGNTVILFHPSNNAEFNATKLERKNFNWELGKKCTVNKLSSDIYQVDSVSNNEKIFVSIRRKNQLLLYNYSLNENEDIESKLVELKTTPVPYVSMSLNAQNITECATINVKHTLQIYDLLKPVYEYDIPYDVNDLQGDCFAQILYCDSNTLAYVDRRKFNIFDKRTNNICSAFKINNSDLNNKFVSICPDKTNHMFYISTFDDILLFDLRQNNILNKYSHSFTSAPYLSKFLSTENNNIFCTSSCKPDEKLIFEQKENVYFLPITLPAINDSFESHLLCNPNMNMSLHMRQRLKTNISGLQLWPNDTNLISIFCMNSMGDIYCHEIVEDNCVKTNTAGENFLKWNNTLNKEVKDELIFSTKEILTDFEFNFKSEPADLESVIKNKRLKDTVNNLRRRNNGYKDTICDLWYITEDDVLRDIEQSSTQATVENWLNQYCSQHEEMDKTT